MRDVKATNPFYAALLVVGVAFAITACAYGVMTVRGLDPRMADEQGLVGLMRQHGLAILVVELVLLAVLTAAAIGTDEYWERGTESRQMASGGREPPEAFGQRSEVRVQRSEVGEDPR